MFMKIRRASFGDRLGNVDPREERELESGRAILASSADHRHGGEGQTSECGRCRGVIRACDATTAAASIRRRASSAAACRRAGIAAYAAATSATSATSTADAAVELAFAGLTNAARARRTVGFVGIATHAVG
jgi:hypothetical protein